MLDLRPGTPMRVLLATDDSEAARSAESWVAMGRWAAPVVIDVLSVASPGFTRLGWGMQTYRTAVRDAVEQLRQSQVIAAERVANEVGQRLQGMGFVTSTLAREGDVAEEILATSEHDPFDLIAIGPRGRSGLAQLLLGSVSRRVINETQRPVLIARRPSVESGPLPGSMLVLVDGALAIDAAIDWLDRAGWVQDVRVTLLGLLGVSPGWEFDDPALVTQVTDALREDVMAALDRIGERFVGRAAEVTADIAMGHPHEGALRVAADLEPDLIVVARPPGRRGRDPFAENIARHAPTSVLVVPRS